MFGRTTPAPGSLASNDCAATKNETTNNVERRKTRLCENTELLNLLAIAFFRDLITDSLQKCLCQLDTFKLAMLVAFKFDTDVPSVSRVDHDPHHPPVIGVNLVAILVELGRLGTDRLGRRHELFHALIAIVLLGRLAINDEIAEVGQRAAARVVYLSDYRGKPLAIG